MKITLIAAMASNRVIGRDNDVPWKLPPDLKRFQRLTMGHVLLMGRRTYESVGKPLPGRTNLVVTRQAGYAPEGVQVARTVEAALAWAKQTGESELFVAGGAEIYRQTLPVADRLQLTRIEEAFAGDTYFPEYDESEWVLVEHEDHGPGEGAPFAYSFQVFERR